MKKFFRLIFNAISDKKYVDTIHFTMYIQYNALCHVIKILSVYCVGFPEFRVNKADQKPKTWLNLMQTMMQTWLNLMQTMMQTWLNLMQTMIPLIANIMYSPWERLLLLSGHQWKGS